MDYLDILDKYGFYYEPGKEREIAEKVFGGKLDGLDLEDPMVKSTLASYVLKEKRDEAKFLELTREVRNAGHLEAEFCIFNYELEKGCVEAAKEILENLERKNYKLPLVMLCYGNLYIAENDIEKALEYFKKSLEMGEEIANLNLASVYMKTKEYDKALEHLTAIDHNTKTANYAKGICYIHTQNEEGLIDILENRNIGDYADLLKCVKILLNPDTIDEERMEKLKQCLILDVNDFEKKAMLDDICEYYFNKEKYKEVIDLTNIYHYYVSPNTQYLKGASYIMLGNEEGYMIIFKAAERGSKKAIKYVELVILNAENNS